MHCYFILSLCCLQNFAGFNCFAIDNIHILTVGLELAANIFNEISPHEPRLQASCSPTVRIRILSIAHMVDSVQPKLN